jgi:hypothetical protein
MHRELFKRIIFGRVEYEKYDNAFARYRNVINLVKKSLTNNTIRSKMAGNKEMS